MVKRKKCGMNEKLKKLIDKVIIDNGFYDIVEKEEGERLDEYEQDETYINKKKVPHKLTEEEFLEIKNHPIYGKEILVKNMYISDVVIDAVEQHHEKIDGSGYPYGLKGNQISKFGKVVCICDVYDAVSNDRSYRKKFSPNEAYELILGGSGSMFDEKIVMKFKETFAIYPLGSCVRLSNEVEGYVVRQNKGFPDRPVIRVLYDSETREPVQFYEIDLLEHLDIVIESIV